jgi:membrane-bound inhibitor of C-type lysozyme
MIWHLLLIPAALGLAACQASRSPAPGTAKTMTYHCDDGRTVQASYPDTGTAVLTLGGQVHHLRITLSASGARYAGDGWQWWTKGLRDGQLAPLQAGETYASIPGVTCQVR